MKGAHPIGYVTPRELEVWSMVAHGLPTKRIAYLLGITYKTVDRHRTQLCRKLDRHCGAELAVEAVRRGVIAVVVRPLTREMGPRAKERWRL